MKKIINIVFWFLFRALGFDTLSERISDKVTNYKLRLNIVPVSYKLFLVLLGVSIGSSSMYVIEHRDTLFVSESNWTFEQVVTVQPVEAKEIEEVKARDLADYIWMKESSRGMKNYSKCEAIGKVNGIGFRIPGDGSFVCFESHEEEMIALKGWLVDKKALGWSELKMLCTYSGNNYSECKK